MDTYEVNQPVFQILYHPSIGTQITIDYDAGGRIEQFTIQYHKWPKPFKLLQRIPSGMLRRLKLRPYSVVFRR